MSDKDLLKQAIADAKTIRETAMANARLTLEEAFKPHLSSMISKRLRNEVNGVNETINPSSSDIGGGTVTVKNPGPKEPSKESSSSSDIPNEKQEVEPMGEGFEFENAEDFHDIHGDGLGNGDGGEDLQGLSGEPLSANPHTPGSPGSERNPLNPGSDHSMDSGSPPMGQQDQELDLEAIIRELEMETAETQPGDSIGEPETLAMGEGFDEPMAGKNVDGAIAPTGKATLRKEATDGPGIRDRKKISSGQSVSEEPMSAGKSAPDLKSEEGLPGGKKVTPGQPVTEEIDLEEILREMEAEEGGTVAETEEIAAENVELKKSIREHREVVQYLRSKLHEVNTLNAKLLYTNKLFKNFNLNLEQKMKIVETFDRANTLREVKLVYTTLAESFNGKMRPSVGKRTAAITEGMSSQTVGSTKPKSPQILAEGGIQASRWQQLAGIKPSKKDS